MRIGIGYDIHRLVEGRKLVLGGVVIPFAKGLYGHSDADVLTHSLCDALLGAAGMGDIGMHFPDSDAEFEGIQSLVLLERVCELVRSKFPRIYNVDSVIIAQAPNLSQHKAEIAASLARVLGIDASTVNIKAKTNEGLGPVGEEKAIAAYSAVLIGC